MKIWTYGEMDTKVQQDLDLQDETFISPNEMIGYFNEALGEAESEIITLNQDYFLTKYYVPVVAGTASYAPPENMYANKIRGMIYTSGSLQYEITRFRRRNKFMQMALIDQFGPNDWYKYDLVNDNVGPSKIVFKPTMRDTAVLAPVASISTPVQMWFIRNCSRVPLIGEYCNREVIALTQVNTTNETIQTYAGTSTVGTVQQGLPGSWPGSIAYVTGDAVKFTIGPNGTLPSPLVAGTVYYVIQTGSGVIKLATTYANAIAGTAINLTTTGTVYFSMQVAATTAIVNATLMDIPEFATFIMQWVKCQCLPKDGDPRLDDAVAKLVQQKKQMVDTLAESVPDDDDQIEMDTSIYEEMS